MSNQRSSPSFRITVGIIFTIIGGVLLNAISPTTGTVYESDGALGRFIIGAIIGTAISFLLTDD